MPGIMSFQIFRRHKRKYFAECPYSGSDFHDMKNGSWDILLDIFFCVLHKKDQTVPLSSWGLLSI